MSEKRDPILYGMMGACLLLSVAALILAIAAYNRGATEVPIPDRPTVERETPGQSPELTESPEIVSDLPKQPDPAPKPEPIEPAPQVVGPMDPDTPVQVVEIVPPMEQWKDGSFRKN